MKLALALTATLPLATLSLAPLEPGVGQVLLGAWYDRNSSDTPSAVNTRLGYKPLNFFQTDYDMSGKKPFKPKPEIVDEFIVQLKESNSDASAYLTVYPFQGLGDNITDEHLRDTLARIKAVIATGRKVFVRFAPEMNGSWFSYGQRPTEFKETWRRCIQFWRQQLGADASKAAFIWAPNSGNGYPWPKDENNPGENYSPDATTQEGKALIQTLDTNKNGKFDELDDPYLIYYPGDEYVDWVGLSIYAYGTMYPWETNDIAPPNKFEGILQGRESGIPNTSWGHYPFYTYFCTDTGVPNITAGNKPFILAETGVAYHFAWANQSWATDGNHPPTPIQDTTRVQVKQSWWRSFLNAEFLAKYPQFKAACFFEFIKPEETTVRDFASLGGVPGSDGFKASVSEVSAAFVEDAKKMSFIVWGNAVQSGGPATVSPSITGSATKSSSASIHIFWPLLAWAATVASI
ncbi:glycoside hydrolase superfamily [Chytriomyces cf. hyalinus JEL632]|nr:glycoside hydrolase superfamily [Chytriomyces cf. hyalinus JEL632]